MYVIVVLSVLAMMIPMAIPVSAAGETIALSTADSTGQLVADGGYNVLGAVVRATVSASANTVNGMTASPVVGGASYVNTNYAARWAEFTAYTTTEVVITAGMSDNTTTAGTDKKWGTIDHTVLTTSGNSSYVTWNEGTKSWSGSFTVYDTVTGLFNATATPNVKTHLAQGLILHYYLVDGYQTIPAGYYESSVLQGMIEDLVPARFATFAGNGTHTDVVTNISGTHTPLTVVSTGEESVKVVVVPEYPNGVAQVPTVNVEVATYNFKTREMEVVPQVRWAGEKAVLEADFGQGREGLPMVKFSLENDSPGSLTPYANLYGADTDETTTQTVWVGPDPVTGLYPVVVECSNQGQVDVNASLYLVNGENLTLENEQYFTVYFIKFESLTLKDVVGKRVLYNNELVLPDGTVAPNTYIISHKAGYWTDAVEGVDGATVWDESLDYENVNTDNETLPVSQDALLRAKVKGWFTNANPTTRPAGEVDIGGTYPLSLPEGRYVLPDDWATLAGPINRIHWDIMCDPSVADVTAPAPAGPYSKGATLVAEAPVVGPFSPSLEIMTDTGWSPYLTHVDALRDIKTVVPDGVINDWDAPMPPAKIIFELQEGSIGFFKDAFKDTIYYIGSAQNQLYTYTNPFYTANIPAHEYLPPTLSNGGYDWDSFGFNGDAYGAYPFWKIINEPDGVVTPEDATKPTKVEVYSDNHGEAMVYVNGDANLDIELSNGAPNNVGLDVPMGISTIQAWADYPYARKHQAIYSDPVIKEWLWEGQFLGPTNGDGRYIVLTAGTNAEITLTNTTSYTDPAAQGYSMKHVVFLFVSDRDGLATDVLDAQVNWTITGDAHIYNNGAPFTGINQCSFGADLMFDANGFLLNPAHPSERAAGGNVKEGKSWLRTPTVAERGIFLKNYPTLEPYDFAVTAVDIYSTTAGEVHVDQQITTTEGVYRRYTDFNTVNSYPLDDPIVLGDANVDGTVNMMDITAIERIILGMDADRTAQADANYNGVIDMGDVIRVEKTYLGLD